MLGLASMTGVLGQNWVNSKAQLLGLRQTLRAHEWLKWKKKVLASTGISAERKEVADGICRGIVTNWKRKERGDQEPFGGSLFTPIQGA